MTYHVIGSLLIVDGSAVAECDMLYGMSLYRSGLLALTYFFMS
jgi:hypothetical protein